MEAKRHKVKGMGKNHKRIQGIKGTRKAEKKMGEKWKTWTEEKNVGKVKMS